MTARDYMVFLFVAFGATYFIVGSALFAPLRVQLAAASLFLRALLYCAYCVGFWAGLAVRATWPLDPFWPLALIEGIKCGLLVMGAIALARAAWPTFLEGAFDREREELERRDVLGDAVRPENGDAADEGDEDDDDG